MKVRVLGSAAGGGVPQWNCRCTNCQAARQPNGPVVPRTQSSVAISAEGEYWFLLNVSADVRQQINAHRNLWPAGNLGRGTSIAGCLLTDAEIDHTSGLLQLREGCRFSIYSTSLVHRWLTDDLPIARIRKKFAEREWIELNEDEPTELMLPSGLPSGLEVTIVDVGHDVPRYVTNDFPGQFGSIVGFLIRDLRTGSNIVYAPGVSKLSSSLATAAEHADAILLDGSFWSDDEPQRLGIGPSSAREMGHIPVSGPAGTLEWLASQTALHRTYVHINNTNPMLYEGGPEHQRVSQAGIRVAEDGDEFDLSGKRFATDRRLARGVGGDTHQ